MKMEQPIYATISGTVEDILVNVGDVVQGGELLVFVIASEDDDELVQRLGSNSGS
jgi:pyruvate/2-oxoglutarate dehydrogenase complex dihydrolipoamide acyltransferase (E2) component